MATTAWVAIGSITLDSTASSVTFSSIPADYRDLVLVIAGTSATSSDMEIRFNGDSGANYSSLYMLGNGSSTSSGTGGTTSIGIGLMNSTQTNALIQIMDYSATDKHKTVLNRENNSSYVFAQAGRWANTAAITTVLVQKTSGTFDVNCTVSLYGSNRL